MNDSVSDYIHDSISSYDPKLLIYNDRVKTDFIVVEKQSLLIK